MEVRKTTLPGVLIVEPRVFEDQRGFFMEAYSAERYRACGIDCSFVQDNLAFSHAGVVRGIHYQVRAAQAKLLSVTSGRVLDVAVDLRRGSPTFGQWVSVELSGDNRRQLYIPAGFAHGLHVLEAATFVYKCSNPYRPEHERGVAYDDPDLAIDWGLAPGERPTLSARDEQLPKLADLGTDDLPLFTDHAVEDAEGAS